MNREVALELLAMVKEAVRWTLGDGVGKRVELWARSLALVSGIVDYSVAFVHGSNEPMPDDLYQEEANEVMSSLCVAADVVISLKESLDASNELMNHQNERLSMSHGLFILSHRYILIVADLIRKGHAK